MRLLVELRFPKHWHTYVVDIDEERERWNEAELGDEDEFLHYHRNIGPVPTSECRALENSFLYGWLESYCQCDDPDAGVLMYPAGKDTTIRAYWEY